MLSCLRPMKAWCETANAVSVLVCAGVTMSGVFSAVFSAVFVDGYLQ